MAAAYHLLIVAPSPSRTLLTPTTQVCQPTMGSSDLECLVPTPLGYQLGLVPVGPESGQQKVTFVGKARKKTYTYVSAFLCPRTSVGEAVY